MCGKTIANMIKGKTPAEICEKFALKDNFTPEEKLQIKRETEWCENK